MDVDQAVIEDVLDLMREREALAHHRLFGVEHDDPAEIGLGGHSRGREALAAGDRQPRQAGQVFLGDDRSEHLEFAAEAVGLPFGDTLGLADPEWAAWHECSQPSDGARRDLSGRERWRLAQTEQRQAILTGGCGHGVPPFVSALSLSSDGVAYLARMSATARSTSSRASGDSFSLLRK